MSLCFNWHNIWYHQILDNFRNYSVLLSVTGHTGSNGGLEKPVLQPKLRVKPDKKHNHHFKKSAKKRRNAMKCKESSAILKFNDGQ